MDNMPRVLVVSHAPFNNASSSRTFNTFFSNWDKNSLAQLYFHFNKPNSDLCKNYFNVTDYEMLNPFISKAKSGHVINDDISRNDLPKNVAGLYKLGRKRSAISIFLRNLIWAGNKWNNDNLNLWIDDFDPEVLLFVSSDYAFSYKIVRAIAARKNIPVVVYLCDDYYFNSKSRVSLFEWINNKIFKKAFENMIACSQEQIYICDLMNNQYSDYFNIKGTTIMTSSEFVNGNKKSSTAKEKRTISYLGNFSLDRWKSLVRIGQALQCIDAEMFLDVYGYEDRDSVLDEFNEKNGIRYKGVVDYQTVKCIISNSTLIVHTEDFSRDNIEKTRYSISTKIADALASGVCVFAYGPSEVASIKYLDDNKAAFVVTEKDDLTESLKIILNSDLLRNYYHSNAKLLAARNHNPETNSLLFQKVIHAAITKAKRDSFPLAGHKGVRLDWEGKT